MKSDYSNITMDHIYISQSRASLSLGYVSLRNLEYPSVPSIPQSWESQASLSLCHLSVSGISVSGISVSGISVSGISVSGILSIPQSRAPRASPSLRHLSLGHPSVSDIPQSRASQSRTTLSLGHLSLQNTSVLEILSIPQSQASLHLRHLLASDISRPWGSIWIIYLSLRHLSLGCRSASDNAQPQTMLSLRQPFASGITQPCALLSLVHPSASPDLAVHLTVMHRSASEYCSTTECNNSN